MRRWTVPALGLGLLLLLPGCGAGVAIVYDGSRKASSEVIGTYLAEQTPGIDQEAGARCIIRGMRTTEVLALGTSDSSRVTPAYRAKVDEVKLRPGVADCLAAVPVTGA